MESNSQGSTLEELLQLRRENAQLKAELTAQREGLRFAASEHVARSSVQSDVSLATEQLERYARQISLKSFGPKAQERLCGSSALVVGAGGLGCPCALYLAAAGVGRLGIVDRDTVALSNLHRQVGHREASVGQHKARSLRDACLAVNASVTVHTHEAGLSPGNALELCAQYDVVIDCSDNAPTRYVVNDACVLAGRPLVSGAAVGTDGQLTVYHHAGGPCYRCLYPECPAAANCSRCEDAGVLGPLPGVIGTLQALEAVKVLTGVGKPLSQALLIYDALMARFSTVRLRQRRPECVACGTSELRDSGGPVGYDYAAFTGGQQMAETAAPVTLLCAAHRMSVQELRAMLEQGQPCALLDVRPEVQFCAARLPGAVNIPAEQLNKRWEEVAAALADRPAGAPAIVMCRRGNDSQSVVRKLLDEGVHQVKDVIGGLDEWSRSIDRSMPLL